MILLATPDGLPCVAASIESKTESKNRRIRSRFSATNWKALYDRLDDLHEPAAGDEEPGDPQDPLLDEGKEDRFLDAVEAD